MANTIRIKRSTTTNTPASLAQGELAWSENTSGNSTRNLFIGEAGPTVTTIITDDATSRGGTAAAPNDSAQDNQTITTGLGIDGADAGSTGNVTLTLATTELTNTAPAAADQFVFNDATDELPKKQVASSIPLSIWGAATAQVNMADQDLNRPILEDYGIKHQTLSISTAPSPDTATFDITLGNSAVLDLESATESVTLTFSNPSPTGNYCEINLIVIQGTTARTINWPGTVDWKGGAPTLSTTNDAVDLFHFFTVDGGFTWYGTYALEAAVGGGTVTSVSAGTLIDMTGTASDPIVNVDLSEATEAVYAPATDYLLFLDGGATGTAAKESGVDFAAALAGVGLDATSGVLEFDAAELTVAAPAGADWLVFDDAGLSRKALISTFNVGLFSNSTALYVSQSDAASASWTWVIDDDSFGTASATTVPTSESVKAYVDAVSASEMTYKGLYNAATNTPALDTGSPSISIGDVYVVSTAGSFFGSVNLQVGDMIIANNTSTDAAALADWDIVYGSVHPVATESVAGIIEIATQAEVDAASSTTLAVVPNYLHNTTFDGGTF